MVFLAESVTLKGAHVEASVRHHLRLRLETTYSRCEVTYSEFDFDTKAI